VGGIGEAAWGVRSGMMCWRACGAHYAYGYNITTGDCVPNGAWLRKGSCISIRAVEGV
jgi:hypothetical protein